MNNFALYVVVRNLPDMTPGKAQAHSGHAASHFASVINNINLPTINDFALHEYFGSRGFGTQINLRATSDLSCDILRNLCTENQFPVGTIIDDTYPFTCSSEFYKQLKSARVLTSEGKYDTNSGLWKVTRKETTAYWYFLNDEVDEINALLKKEFVLA